MLVVFPLGLLTISVVCDLVGFASVAPGRWHDMAYWMIGFGIIGALAAGVFGLVDWVAIPQGTRAKAVGAWHGIGNVVVVLLFVASWAMRYRLSTAPPMGAYVLSFVGIGLALVTGWLGGELVDRLGVGVSDHAGLDAPSSLQKSRA